MKGLIAILCVLLVRAPSGAAGGRLLMTILHTNDVHARFDQSNSVGGSCSAKDSADNNCFGGMARLKTKVDEIRAEDKNTLFMNAGDYYQGTLLYTRFKWKITADFTNRLKYDVVSLGNHEFDDGVSGLVPYLENVHFPVLACNLDVSKEPSLQGKIHCSHEFQVGGETVAVIGYLTPETKDLAYTGNVIFLDEVKALQAEADRLKEKGINKIIALGHSGFTMDKEIARRVKGLDIVVGGHTNTFLYTGTPPSTEERVEGPYPTVITQEDGHRVYVITDYAYAKYLGSLTVQFSEDGTVEHALGNPILLDKSVKMDPEIVAAFEPYKEEIAEMTNEVVGRTFVQLMGDRKVCRLRECNLGNFLADALARFHLRGPSDGFWNKYNIAIYNSGGIRSSINEKDNEGNITMGDALTIAPFGNTVDTVRFYGRGLKQVMEHSVENYDITDENAPGAFLQVSGLRVTYDLSKPSRSRVTDLKVLCSKCRIPKYLDVEDGELYDVVVPSYMIDGGDGFSIIKETAQAIQKPGNLDSEIIVSHIRRTSPVIMGEENRIIFVINKTPGLHSSYINVLIFVSHTLSWLPFI